MGFDLPLGAEIFAFERFDPPHPLRGKSRRTDRNWFGSIPMVPVASPPEPEPPPLESSGPPRKNCTLLCQQVKAARWPVRGQAGFAAPQQRRCLWERSSRR